MLFANTEKGADVTYIYCSLTQTAIHCGLDPLGYYDWLLRNLPADKEKQKAFDYPSYLPWSERIPVRLRAGHPETEEKKD